MRQKINSKCILETERIYLNKLRNMSGQERLVISNGLYMLATNIAKAGIMNQKPGISEKELKKELLKRIYKNESYRNFINSM